MFLPLHENVPIWARMGRKKLPTSLTEIDIVGSVGGAIQKASSETKRLADQFYKKQFNIMDASIPDDDEIGMLHPMVQAAYRLKRLLRDGDFSTREQSSLEVALVKQVNAIQDKIDENGNRIAKLALQLHASKQAGLGDDDADDDDELLKQAEALGIKVG